MRKSKSENVKILFYGVLRDIMGKKQILFDVSGLENKTVSDIMKVLIDRFPSLKEKKFEIALNREVIRKEDYKLCKVKDGDEIALLPPFSGG